MHSGFRGVVEFAGRHVVAHHVAAMLVKPHFLRFRMPVEADRVADAARESFQPGAVRLHSVNGSVDVRIHLADVAGRTHRHVQQAVRAESDEFPAVMAVARELVADHHRFGRILQAALDIVVAQDAADLGDIERTVAEGDAVRGIESPGDGDDLVGPAVAVGIGQRVHRAFGARADEHRASVAERERPGVVDIVGEHGDPEPRWQLDAIDRRRGVGGCREAGCKGQRRGQRSERLGHSHRMLLCRAHGKDNGLPVQVPAGPLNA